LGLAGTELIRMRTWGTGDDRRGGYLRASPCSMVDIIQPLLEPILFQKAAEKGATFAFNTEYVRHEQDSNRVTATLRDRLDGRMFTVQARYMVGADGARSSVVEHLGLPVEGRMARAGSVYTIFNADLSRYSKHRPSILNWIVTPDASFGEIGMGLLRAVRPWTQWIAGWGVDISKGDPDLSESNVREKIGILIGDAEIKPEIVRTSVWLINQAYVTQYSKRRVFCGGDAVSHCQLKQCNFALFHLSLWFDVPCNEQEVHARLSRIHCRETFANSCSVYDVEIHGSVFIFQLY
jgi:2,4-dichlorophenol 6-monooxygenase